MSDAPSDSNDNAIISAVSTLIDGCDSLSVAVSTFINLVGVPSGFELSDFETVDDNVVCVEPIHSDDRSIIDAVNGTVESDDEEESQEGSQEPEKVVGAEEAQQMIENLRIFFFNQTDTDLNRFVELDRLKAEITLSRLSNRHQSSIPDFFQSRLACFAYKGILCFC